MEPLTVILLRGLERLIAVLIGGFLCWLGYRLFLDVPVKSDSTGKFALPAGTTIQLTRVGPGVFFSLFGAGIVVMSVISPVKYADSTAAQATGSAATATATAGSPAPAPAVAVVTREFSGAMPTTQMSDASRQAARNLHRMDIAALNRLSGDLKDDLNSSRRADYQTAVPRIKLSIMRNLWGEDWGDFVAFEQWVRTGTTEPPHDPANKPAAEYFHSK